MTGTNRPGADRNAGTEQGEYVRELEQYRRRLDGAMFAGDLAWWEMDVETGEVEFHENKADMLGRSPADFAHYEDFTDLLHPDDYEQAMQAMRDHLEGRAEKYDTEYRIRTASDEYRWFHDIGGVTERRDDGSPQKVTGVVVDITRRKTVERNLRETNRQLSLLNRIVRHDINNDMSIIEGWATLLREELPPEKKDIPERILRASRHTTELTRDVRDLMEILDDEEGEVQLQSVDLARVVEAEVERVRRSFDAVEIRIRGENPSVDVQANAMLSSVVGNLLNNAVQHNDKDTAKITIETDVRERTVVLTVADNGPGIPENRRDEIFDREVKGLDSDGTGVGLYLVGILVEAYGGEVSVSAREPNGTVFAVKLPRAEGS